MAKDGIGCIFRVERMVTCKLISTARRQSLSGPTGSADVRREETRIHFYLCVYPRDCSVCQRVRARLCDPMCDRVPMHARARARVCVCVCVCLCVCDRVCFHVRAR
jgi:hypothetical protein